jgi:hypothetical protein
LTRWWTSSTLTGRRAAIIKFPETVSTGTVDGELVLLDTEAGVYFGLNRVATRMVELLRRFGDAERVVEELGKEYKAPAERLREDLRTLIRSLVEKGLVIEETE